MEKRALRVGSGGLEEQRDGLGFGLGAGQIDQAEGIGEVVGDVGFAAQEDHGARAEIGPGQLDPLAHADEKGQVVRHVGLDAGRGDGVSRLGRVERGGHLGEPGQQRPGNQ